MTDQGKDRAKDQWGGDTARSDFQTLLGHALMDADFRDQLTNTSTRAQAVRSITGKEMSKELSAAIDDALASLQNLAAAFGDYRAAT